MSGEWTEGAICLLRQCWAEGHSTAEIGRRIGISKNAVVGKAHRWIFPDAPHQYGAVALSRPLRLSRERRGSPR